jgi:hypothetical protein
MKQELTTPEAQANRVMGERRMVGIEWIDFKATTPISVMVTEKPANVEVKRKRARRLLWHKLVRPTLGNIVLFGCLLGLFSFYCLNCVVRVFGLRKDKPSQWEQMRRLSCHFGLAFLFAAGLMGCVGYVGPGPGPVYGGPYIDGPDFYVFGGGYHGHYAGAFSHRGAASRGFGGHGGHR